MSRLHLTEPRLDSMMSLTEIARALGTSPYLAQRLIRSGWIQPTLSEVAALAKRQIITSSGPVALLRMGMPETITETEADGSTTSRKIGIAPDYDDEQILEAVRRWWRCSPEDILDSGVVLVSFSGFVVAVAEFTALEDSIRQDRFVRHSFQARLLGRVIDLGSGLSRHLVEHPANDVLGHRFLHNRQGNPLALEVLG